MDKLTIDTHILIWYVEGIILSEAQINLIETARKNNLLHISSISVWEIIMLARKAKITLSINLNTWIDKMLAIPGLNLIELSVPVMLQACELPNYEHKDPADRFIIASARLINSYLMTADQKIIDYANQGHLKLASC
jgi:PIN domain nuclease of toxin-antitoxin system